MVKLAFLGGVLGVLTWNGFGISQLFAGLVAVGLGLFVLAVALAALASVFEHLGRAPTLLGVVRSRQVQRRPPLA